MSEESQILKSEIKNLKKTKILSVNYNRIDFGKFSTVQKGDAFRKWAQWQILNTNIYLISVTNSYRFRGYHGDMEYTPHYRTSKYIFCYLEFDSHFPDTIIRPANISSRFINLFEHFAITIPGQPAFTYKYMVETVNEAKTLELLHPNLTNLISRTDELTIDIRDNKCLLHYSHAIRKGDAEMLVQIAEMILQ